MLVKLNIGIHLGDRFYNYKKEVNLLKEAVERHFSKVMLQIEAGLPDVIEHEQDKDDLIMAGSDDTWTCSTCMTVNTKTQA